jgi:CO/xanthine dehydrogenase FAD-binding subunit
LTQPLYLRPARVEEALAALAGRPLTVLAGGTDFYPARIGRSWCENILDISRLNSLRSIARDGRTWRLGALTTWSDILRTPLPRLFDGLKAAARELGGPQIQNAGTLAGNICNASPAADGVPVLLALAAAVELSSVHGRRIVPLAEFIADKQRTVRRPDELVTALLVPAHGPRVRSSFVKLGARRYLVISIVMVAATVELDDADRVTGAAVAVGACTPVATRLPALEARLRGCVAGALEDEVRDADLSGLSPLTDVRGTAAFRLDAAAQLIRRALRALGDG